MTESAFSVSVLMCHAPIVIPDFAASRGELCCRTTAAMEKAADLLVSRAPSVVVLLSPHTPRYRSAFGVVEGSTISGDFSSFGRPDLRAVFSSDRHIQENIERIALELGVDVKPVPANRLDHGALVPLYFLKKAGFEGKVIVVGFPEEYSQASNAAMGSVLNKAALSGDGNWALLASGDMSHRLSPGAPAGFHPNANRFDRLVVKCVETGDYSGIVSIDEDLRDIAAEDIVDSLQITHAALKGDCVGRQFLSYEGPFGVGYMVAVLCDVRQGKI